MAFHLGDDGRGGVGAVFEVASDVGRQASCTDEPSDCRSSSAIFVSRMSDVTRKASKSNAACRSCSQRKRDTILNGLHRTRAS